MIYITGAGGRLGSEVVKFFPHAKRIGRGDPLDFSDAEVVIHLAASLNFNNPKELWESNVELTRRVVGAMPKTARLIFASSISVYGKKLAQIPADETTPCQPDSAYAKSKYEAERLAVQHPNSVALRIGVIYGPDEKFKEFFTFLRRIEKGRIFIVGNGTNRIPFVHVQDVVQAIQGALQAPPGVYLVAGEPVEQEKAYRMAAELLGVAPPKLHIPLWVAQLFSFFRLIPLEHVSILFYDRVFDCSKAKKFLHLKPRSFAKGLKEMVEAYQKLKVK